MVTWHGYHDGNILRQILGSNLSELTNHQWVLLRQHSTESKTPHFHNTLPPDGSWKWKMVSWKMCGLSPNGLFSHFHDYGEEGYHNWIMSWHKAGYHSATKDSNGWQPQTLAAHCCASKKKLGCCSPVSRRQQRAKMHKMFLGVFVAFAEWRLSDWTVGNVNLLQYPWRSEDMWATKKNPNLLSIESWLVNRDPYNGLL